MTRTIGTAAVVFIAVVMVYFLRDDSAEKSIRVLTDFNAEILHEDSEKGQPASPLVSTANTSKTAIAADRDVRDRQVQAKLYAFMDNTAHISPERVTLEAERIAKNLTDILNRPEDNPEALIMENEQGEKWVRLQYKNKIVRYLPAF